MPHLQPEPAANPINPKYFIGAKPQTHQGNLRQLHPAIIKRLVPLPNWVNWRWELNKNGDAWTRFAPRKGGLKMPRREYVKGQHLTGGDFPTTDPRKAAIRKGQFLTGDPQPGAIKHPPLPSDLAEFESAAAEADKLAVQDLDEIRQRLAHAQQMLNDLRAAARRR